MEKSSQRALVIGSAPAAYVAACVREAAGRHGEVLVLAKGAANAGLAGPNVRVRAFEGQLDIRNKSLAKALLGWRPDVVYIVYGSWLGHDNVFLAVHFYLRLARKRYAAFLFSKTAQPVDLRQRLTHPFTRVDLALSPLHWLALPLYLLVRLMAPLLLVRFEPMRPSALGHYEELEIYLGKKRAGEFPPRCLDVFCYKDTPCNAQILKMYRRKVCVVPLARYLLTWNHYIPGGDRHALHLRPWDYATLITQRECSVAFDPDEARQGRERAAALGVDVDKPFVCLGFRDGLFDSTVRLGLYGRPDDKDARRQLDLHAFRNADIANALPAVRFLHEAGYAVVRMGSKARPLPESMTPHAFDYANSPARSEFLDIYLGATCRFFITTGYGLDTPPLVFRRPMVSVNTEYRLLRPNILYIFRHHWSKALGRPLRLREIFATGAAFYAMTTQFEENGVELRENTPEEILDAVREMEARTRGTWVEDDEDRALQQRFWDIVRPYYLPQYATRAYCDSIRIGSRFLKGQPDFLD